MGAVRKISTGFGLWALITTCIALFFASWLAVEISGAFTALAGVVLGLAIWGLFYIAMTALQVSAFSSLVGFFLASLACDTLRVLGGACFFATTRYPTDLKERRRGGCTQRPMPEGKDIIASWHKQMVLRR
jgi:hypothetical protein